jgi:hypothetical protein
LPGRPEQFNQFLVEQRRSARMPVRKQRLVLFPPVFLKVRNQLLAALQDHLRPPPRLNVAAVVNRRGAIGIEDRDSISQPGLIAMLGLLARALAQAAGSPHASS